MGELLYFHNYKKNHSFKKNLSALLKEAFEVQEKEEKVTNSGIFISDFERMREMIEKEMSKELLEKNALESEFFLCMKYVSKLLSETARQPLFSLYILDYLSKIESKEDHLPFKEAADLCFILCSLFPERTERRMMRWNDYVMMGKSLYGSFYQKSGLDIAYYMSTKYQTIAVIAHNALGK